MGSNKNESNPEPTIEKKILENVMAIQEKLDEMDEKLDEAIEKINEIGRF